MCLVLTSEFSSGTIQAWEVSVDENSVRELIRYTRALLVLQVQALGKTEDQVKPETLLARAGLSAREIAELLGKNPAAVAKAIQRSGREAA